jgi:hypothetical protein
MKTWRMGNVEVCRKSQEPSLSKPGRTKLSRVLMPTGRADDASPDVRCPARECRGHTGHAPRARGTHAAVTDEIETPIPSFRIAFLRLWHLMTLAIARHPVIAEMAVIHSATQHHYSSGPLSHELIKEDTGDESNSANDQNDQYEHSTSIR